jgi:uncharacterized membrane protein
VTGDLLQFLLAQTQPAAQGFFHQWVTEWKIHPVLVNFTASLIPVSVGSDLAARLFRVASLRTVAWWTMIFAVVITPFTAAAGWLFWMPDDDGVTGMMIHKWLGTSLAVVFLGLLAWRCRLQSKDRPVSWLYLLVALVIVGALVYQGMLGGDKTFGEM